MSIHNIPTTRQKAAAILSGRKLQMLEEAGLMVVEIDLMRRIEKVFDDAPWKGYIEHDRYTAWYNEKLDPVWAEVARELNGVTKAGWKRQ